MLQEVGSAAAKEAEVVRAARARAVVGFIVGGFYEVVPRDGRARVSFSASSEGAKRISVSECVSSRTVKGARMQRRER